MTSCQCQGIEREFGLREAQQQLRRYRRRGPARTTRALIGVLVEMGVEGRTLLDIGGGVGAIQHALLAAGAGRVRSVEASSAYAAAADEEAERRGYAERIEAWRGDFVDLAAAVPPADIVTLDRVICCYHDMRGLVTASAGHATRALGLVYPREAWWLRPLFALGNVVFRLRRSAFRIYLHRRTDVEAIIREHGLHPTFRQQFGIWQVAVFAA